MNDYKKLIDELPAPQTKEEQYIYALVCSVADVKNKNKLSDSPFWRLEKYWRAFYLITADNLKKNNDVIAGIQDNVSANTDNIAINTKSIETNAGNIFSNTRDIKRNADGIDRLDAVKANVKHKHVMADITDLDIKAPKWEDIEGKPNFAKVATTGSYNDLLDKPIITNYYTKSEIDALLAASGGGDGITLTPQQIANLNADHSKYLTEHQSLAGYATENWVSQQGYLTEHQDISNVERVAAKKLSNNGYYKTESGLIIQWGVVTTTTANSWKTTDFPTPFTTRNYSVCVTDRNGTAVTRAYNLSASQVNILSTVATTVQWIAIGY